MGEEFKIGIDSIRGVKFSEIVDIPVTMDLLEHITAYSGDTMTLLILDVYLQYLLTGTTDVDDLPLLKEAESIFY
jgi:hypothetical protein